MKKLFLTLMCVVAVAASAFAETKHYERVTKLTQLTEGKHYVILSSAAYNGAIYGVTSFTSTASTTAAEPIGALNGVDADAASIDVEEGTLQEFMLSSTGTSGVFFITNGTVGKSGGKWIGGRMNTANKFYLMNNSGSNPSNQSWYGQIITFDGTNGAFKAYTSNYSSVTWGFIFSEGFVNKAPANIDAYPVFFVEAEATPVGEISLYLPDNLTVTIGDDPIDTDFEVKGAGDNAETIAANTTFTIDDTAIATYANGKITPVAIGTTTLTATYVDGDKTYTATCAITVNGKDAVIYGDKGDASRNTAIAGGAPVEVRGVTVYAGKSSYNAPVLEEGTNYTLKYGAYEAIADNKPNEPNFDKVSDVVSISETGEITPLKEGSAVIAISIVSDEYEATPFGYAFTVKPAEKKKSTITVAAGKANFTVGGKDGYTKALEAGEEALEIEVDDDVTYYMEPFSGYDLVKATTEDAEGQVTELTLGTNNSIHLIKVEGSNMLSNYTLTFAPMGKITAEGYGPVTVKYQGLDNNTETKTINVGESLSIVDDRTYYIYGGLDTELVSVTGLELQTENAPEGVKAPYVVINENVLDPNFSLTATTEPEKIDVVFNVSGGKAQFVQNYGEANQTVTELPTGTTTIEHLNPILTYYIVAADDCTLLSVKDSNNASEYIYNMYDGSSAVGNTWDRAYVQIDPKFNNTLSTSYTIEAAQYTTFTCTGGNAVLMHDNGTGGWATDENLDAGTQNVTVLLSGDVKTYYICAADGYELTNVLGDGEAMTIADCEEQMPYATNCVQFNTSEAPSQISITATKKQTPPATTVSGQEISYKFRESKSLDLSEIDSNNYLNVGSKMLGDGGAVVMTVGGADCQYVEDQYLQIPAGGEITLSFTDEVSSFEQIELYYDNDQKLTCNVGSMTTGNYGEDIWTPQEAQVKNLWDDANLYFNDLGNDYFYNVPNAVTFDKDKVTMNITEAPGNYDGFYMCTGVSLEKGKDYIFKYDVETSPSSDYLPQVILAYIGEDGLDVPLSDPSTDNVREFTCDTNVSNLMFNVQIGGCPANTTISISNISLTEVAAAPAAAPAMNVVRDADGKITEVTFTPAGDSPVNLRSMFVTYDGPELPTRIENVEASANDAEAVYYNLQGVRVENPANGIFIRVQGNKVDKILVK